MPFKKKEYGYSSLTNNECFEKPLKFNNQDNNEKNIIFLEIDHTS